MALHEALAQRIVVHHRLPPLEHDEFEPNLQHLPRLAGIEVPLFEIAALAAIVQAINGLTRKTKRLAHHALNAATLGRAKVVSAAHVEAARSEVA